MQNDLFNPMARKSDPLSSHDAATAHEKSGRRKAWADRLLEMVREYPGYTTNQLAVSWWTAQPYMKAVTGVGAGTRLDFELLFQARDNFHKRSSELRRANKIRSSDWSRSEPLRWFPATP